MKAVVVYESMYGNTHLVAEAVATGLGGQADDVVVVASAGDATNALLADTDLVVVGGPTHVHGMSRASTRKAAAEAAQKPGSELDLDPDAEGDGLREWFDSIGSLPPAAAAFDTRMHGPAAFTGRASKGIAQRLPRDGCRLVVEPESFLVSKENHLDDDELAHARTWGQRLAVATVHAG